MAKYNTDMHPVPEIVGECERCGKQRATVEADCGELLCAECNAQHACDICDICE